MKLPYQSNKNLFKRATVVALPVLLLSGGWWVKSHFNHTGQNLTTNVPAGSEAPGATRAQSTPSLTTPLADATRTAAPSAQEPPSPPAQGTESHASRVAMTGRNEASPGRTSDSNKAANTTAGQTPSQSLLSHPAPVAESHPEGCFILTFKHKPLPSHSSDDECSHHRNLIKLDRLAELGQEGQATKQETSPASVCIRVNGTPVRHEAVPGKIGEFVIGAVAGPNDVITARFCVGKAKCNEGCPYPNQEKVKKDEFLEAIGAGADADGDTTTAAWQASDGEKNAQVNKALDGEIKKEVEEKEVAKNRTAPSNTKLEIFKDWISGTEAPACGSHPESARTTASR